MWSPGFTVRDSGSVDVEYEPVHVHPSSPELLPDVPLLVNEPVGTELEVRWWATARNADKRISGTFTLVVVEPTLDFEALPGA